MYWGPVPTTLKIAPHILKHLARQEIFITDVYAVPREKKRYETTEMIWKSVKLQQGTI